MALSVMGQSTTGSITGTVKDNTGAPIPNATVSIKNTATSFTRALTTNNTGIFSAPLLPPGAYDITVETKGFKKHEMKSVKLNAIEIINVGEIALEVGDVSESITVSGENTRIEIQSESGERSGLVTNAQLKDLALNGRNYHDFLKTMPGIITGSMSSGQVSSSTGSLGAFNVNGTRAAFKELTVDGSSNIDTGNNTDTHAALNPDAIAEMKVLTSNFQAEYGKAAGAFISVVSKSGTNQFHGGVRWFHRHDSLNANNYFRNAKGQRADGHEIESRNLYRFNSEGYEIGGPVYLPFLGINKNKDKLFFYWNQEFYQQLVPEGARNIRVPSALERQGNFSQTTDGNGNAVKIIVPGSNKNCGGDANGDGFFDGNIIPSTCFYQYGAAILNIYPQSNISGFNQYNYTSSVSTKYPRREETIRVDYNISEKTHLSARYTNNKEERLLSYGSWASATNFPLSPVSFPRPGRNGVVTLTHTFSPTLTNEFIFGPSSNFIEYIPGDENAKAATYGIKIPKLFPGNGAGYLPNFRYGGITNQSFPDMDYNGMPFYNQNHTFNFIDNVSKIVGSHTLKAGIYVQRSRKDQTVFARTDGDINFSSDANNPNNTGHPYANALLGIYNSYIQADKSPKGLYRYTNAEWYVQDNWKVNRKLTLDYGLRMSWYQPQYEARNQAGSFSPVYFNPAKAPRLYFPVCIDNKYPCRTSENASSLRAMDPTLIKAGVSPTLTNTKTPNYIATFVAGTGDIANGISNEVPGGYNSRGIQWSPRFGFAYDLSGSGKTIIRGGGGISYDRVNGNIAFDQIANPPTIIQPQLLYGNLANVTSVDPNNLGNALIAPSNIVGYDLKGNVPNVYSLSLSVQRDVGFNTVLDVAYVGTLARHLFQARALNATPYNYLFTRDAQDPTYYGFDGAVPISDSGATQAHKDAGFAFDGRFALPSNLIRNYAGHGDIRYGEMAGSTNFHSLQVAINRRFSSNFTFSVAYTFSKAMGTVTNDDRGFVSAYDTRKHDYRLLEFDRTHSFVTTYVYKFPQFGSRFGNNALTRGLLNGWQVSGITSFISGNPYELGVGIGGGINSTQRISGSWNEPARFQLIGDASAGKDGLLINPGAFALPPIGGQGYGNRTYLRNPGINNTDLSIFKNIPIGNPDKNRMIQLRLEAFNAFNHTQFSGVNAGTALSVKGVSNNDIFNNYGSAVITNNLRPTGSIAPLGTYFGEYNGARDPRIVQLAVKFYF